MDYERSLDQCRCVGGVYPCTGACEASLTGYMDCGAVLAPVRLVPRLPGAVSASEWRMHLPTDSATRKGLPMARGLIDYFPDALADVARLSLIANEKHNPGEELHWSKGKSNDHADCVVRHIADRTEIDPEDGVLHWTKVAWRALAGLQTEIEKRRERGEQYP